MLDIKLIRENPQDTEEKLRRKEPDTNLTSILEMDEKIRDLKTRGEQLKSQRNQLSKVIGEKKRKGEYADDVMNQANSMADEIASIDEELKTLEANFLDQMAKLPNLPEDDVKISQDPKENVVLREFGKKPEFNFPSKNHLELDEKLYLFDFARGAKIAGTGWPVYHGLGARLEWALINYMLEMNFNSGFEFWLPPILIRPEILYGSGQLPKFELQQFKITDDEYNLYMIPTAEVSLNGLHHDEIFEEEDLPKKYVAYTPCFRREAGAAGAQERGLIRMHQFNKVEMFCFTKPEDSKQMFDFMVGNAEKILQGLELHYRSTLLVTGDMSYASARTIDIEVWLPGQNRYYEVSSVSNCTDFQARRSRIRFRRKGQKPEFVHTLNGSGLATSRLMVAILENNQNADGTVNIPKVLQPYMNGMEMLTINDKR